MTDFRRPHYFAYRVSQFTFALQRLATEGRGQWRFTGAADGTKVEWIYAFTARSPLAYPPLLVFAQWWWRGFMRVGLRASKRLSRAGRLPPPSPDQRAAREASRHPLPRPPPRADRGPGGAGHAPSPEAKPDRPPRHSSSARW